MWCNYPRNFNIAESERSKFMKLDVRLRFGKILYFARLPSIHLFQLVTCSVYAGMYNIVSVLLVLIESDVVFRRSEAGLRGCRTHYCCKT